MEFTPKAKPSPENFQVCRICLRSISPTEFPADLFEDSLDSHRTLAEVVALLCDVVVSPEERTLPRWCCVHCQRQVLEASQLRTLCQESDRRLRGIGMVDVKEEDNASFCMEVEMIKEDNDSPEYDEDVTDEGLKLEYEIDEQFLYMDREQSISAEESDVRKVDGRKSRKGKGYSEETVEDVVKMIRNGLMSISMASKRYKIAYSALYYRLKISDTDSPFTKASYPFITSNEETQLVRWLKEMLAKGFAVTSYNVEQKVFNLLTEYPRPNLFKENRPGKYWMTKFSKRHPELRLDEDREKLPLSSLEQEVRKWFSTILEYFAQHDLNEVVNDPSRVLHLCETSFTRKGYNPACVQLAIRKKDITILHCVSADGLTFSPTVVLDSKKVEQEVKGSFAPLDRVKLSVSGSITATVLTSCITEQIHATLVRRKVKFPVILFYDCHACPVAFEAADACLEHDIILVAMYPFASKLIQPAERGIYGLLKQNSVENAVEIQRGNKVTLDKFAAALARAFADTTEQSTIQQTFRRTGLFPFDVSAIDFRLFPTER